MTFEQFYVNESYTQEMEDWFKERTNKHIGLVQKYAGLIYKFNPKIFERLPEIVERHDESKLTNDIERVPYIYLSWDYHCKDLKKPFEMFSKIKDDVFNATMHHVKSNKHHPEFWAGETANINKEDRDAITKELVDATMMPDLYLGEMVSDWMAMAKEKENTVRDWADKTVNKRWKFTDNQKDLIYKLIDNVKE
jgi:hypothetical protein